MKIWSTDGRLDVVVLGPMSADKGGVSLSSNCETIRDVVTELLEEPDLRALYEEAGFQTYSVAFPEGWQGADIGTNVFTAIDQADLVILDMSAKDGESGPSANVMYELGLVHALGLPYLMVNKTGCTLPFYLRNLQALRLAAEGYPAAAELKRKLRTKLKSFLNPKVSSSFETNPVSMHYGDAAVIDISAAMGLAAGYYHNFIYRVLVDPNYLRAYRAAYDRVVILMPNDLSGTAFSDLANLQQLLKTHSTPPLGNPTLTAKDKKGEIRKASVHTLGRCIFDVPTTVYALRHSPRYLRRMNNMQGREESDPELYRMEQRLLQKFRQSVEYQLRCAHNLHDLSRASFHVARIPTTAEEVAALFS